MKKLILVIKQKENKSKSNQGSFISIKKTKTLKKNDNINNTQKISLIF